eukprot:CAMPEP_0119138888 /NCGR_PEP_ID=MMETSP1310-20130426/26520_1 /TAXON_ID=464262 /ORGANISM="Genus nov. species nov., Strain RCC2339" /LENGTH=146 /DNA_ID=CAMNT_0007130125 /DNA_START=46 /DNA_END=483 /DNA_ORIENTATION=+
MNVLKLAMVVLAGAVVAYGHCGVPCGIFDDPERVAILSEHATTIAKAQREYKRLSVSDSVQDTHRAIRWVMTQEDHADKIIDLMGSYFLAQRVKPGDDHEAYLRTLEIHHQVILTALAAKQSVEESKVDALNEAIAMLSHLYPDHH